MTLYKPNKKGSITSVIGAVDILLVGIFAIIGEKIIKCSAEYDDLKKISSKTGIPVKDLKNYIEQDYKIKFRSD